MNIDELARTIMPSRTTLLFGAGSSIPSGAPSGTQLAARLARGLNPEPEGTELSEIAQIFENRKGRAELVAKVREALAELQPTSGLLALPEFDWLSIYTTNFDTLIEQAYRAKGRNLDIYRSNFDVSQTPRRDATPLYKIHGCMTQDGADGSRSGMLITEADYDNHEQFRQILFNSLTQHMFTSDTVIIGQSLGDRHLKDLARRVVSLRQEGVASRIFLLVYEYDPDRAELFTRLGLEVIRSDLDSFLLALLRAGKNAETPAYSTSSDSALLTPALTMTSTDVAHAAGLAPSAIKLFNGSPGTYADIRNGMTIPRVGQKRLEDASRGTRGNFLVVEGARGVGKTTLARAYLLTVADRRIHAWEHGSDHELDVEAWIGVESRLRALGEDGMLLIDDCYRNLNAVNRLVNQLGALDRSHLRIVVTVDSARWSVASKSAYFFSKGSLVRLSVLEPSDIEALVALVDRKPEIRSLVESTFLALGRPARVRRLRDKCSADMFVCLKNIFANDSLDEILLQEYSSLDAQPRDVYRYVAAIQALGGFVHRQLIMRLLNIPATSLNPLLSLLEGIVTEHVIDPRSGIYGWSTRHDVIAGVIARIKFADQLELVNLLEQLIDGVNPSVRIELETAIAIATDDLGITRVVDPEAQVKLFRKLVTAIPAHRTPRRRLIKFFLNRDMLTEATNEVVAFERSIGSDAVVARYKATIYMRKAATMINVDNEDRRSMLLEAENILRRSIADGYGDHRTAVTLGQVGMEMVRLFGDFDIADDAIDFLREFEATNGDPEIQRERRALEDQVARAYALSGAGVAVLEEE